MIGKIKKTLFSQFTIVSVLLLLQVALLYSLVTYLIETRLVKKNMPVDTAAYAQNDAECPKDGEMVNTQEEKK